MAFSFDNNRERKKTGITMKVETFVAAGKPQNCVVKTGKTIYFILNTKLAQEK